MILMKREEYHIGMLKYATFHVITGSFCKEIKFKDYSEFRFRIQRQLSLTINFPKFCSTSSTLYSKYL